jgi:hypothetical protein
MPHGPGERGEHVGLDEGTTDTTNAGVRCFAVETAATEENVVTYVMADEVRLVPLAQQASAQGSGDPHQHRVIEVTERGRL